MLAGEIIHPDQGQAQWEDSPGKILGLVLVVPSQHEEYPQIQRQHF